MSGANDADDDEPANNNDISNNNDTTNRPPPPHSSDPSMTFPLQPSRNYLQQQRHNRNVTPHTASLMNLFARPATAPMTPLTPPLSEVGAADPESTGYHYGALPRVDSAPSLPEEDEYEENFDDEQSVISVSTPDHDSLDEDSTTPLNSNYAATSNTAGERAPLLLPSPSAFVGRQKTVKVSNKTTSSEKSYSTITHNRDDTHLIDNLSRGQHQQQQSWPWGNKEQQYYQGGEHKVQFQSERESSDDDIPSSKDEQQQQQQPVETKSKRSSLLHSSTLLLSKTGLSTPHQIKSTLIGAFLFSLYQLVFIFAEASAITRPSHPPSSSSMLLSPMAHMACFGSLVVIPILIAVLGGDYPALYPALDMFMAPFMAKMAMDIDEVLVLQQHDEDDNDVFLATFVALNGFGMAVCAVLCVLASHVKLANLALFLPYPVLCGFFSSVGLSIWMSSFKVDTGIAVQHFWGSEHRLFLVMKHVPSILSGIALYLLAPKSPLYLIGIVACTIALAYSTMMLTGTSLQEAQDLGFFWEEKEVVMSPQAYNDYPMHLWSQGVFKKISWDAFRNGVPDVIAMGLIYLIRCSLQAAALKRNLANYLRNKEAADTAVSDGQPSIMADKSRKEDEQPKRKPKDVLQVLMWFANTQFVSAIVGGFAVIPSIGLSNTFVKIGAESRAPQLVSCLLVLGCYLSNFRLISFVPKCTFSSLLVMASIDLLVNWFVKSFRKTGSEWFVIPVIVLSGQMFGVLQSVALGVAMSTLVFVKSFYQAGTVKFISNGLMLRSTIERQSEDNVWLDRNGDMIQTLVLQNYLFFGNATSVLKYISSMFDDIEVAKGSLLPPKPKYLVLDMSIVSGVDISAVDCFADVTSLCKTQGCKLIISGSSKMVRHALIAGNVKPASHPHLSFVEDLEAALGMAEDGLLKFVAHNEERIRKNHLRGAHLRRISQMDGEEIDIGLRLALKQIDEQHNLSFATYLQGLAAYTTAMDLEAGEQLDLPRGLYFVESGMIKAEADTSASLTRGRQKIFATPVLGRSTDSIGQLTARSATIGRGQAALKNAPGMMSQFSHTFRLARVGPGFVIGCISEFTGQEIPGTFICMTESRVHYLPFETIEELEMSKPVLIMHLYKLLAHLGARRQELTIGQLSTLRSIMSSSAPSKPISRKALAHLSENYQP